MARDGRPSEYTKEIALKVCERISLGQSLKTVCKADDMPVPATVFKWMRDNEDFLKLYARATEERTEALSEELLDIADDSTNDWMTLNDRDVPDHENIQRSRLRVDTRKWLMSKMKPKKYGDKLDLTSGGEKLPTPLLAILPKDEPAQESN